MALRDWPLGHLPYYSMNYKSTTSYDCHTKFGLQPALSLLTLPTQHTTSTHPAPSGHHQLNSLPHPHPMEYLNTDQTTVPLYPNPQPRHAIPYTTGSSSTPTQSLHPSQTSALAPQTHYPSFPRIIIPPQSHTQDGYQRKTQRGTTENDDNTFFMGSDAQCTTTIEQRSRQRSMHNDE